MSSKRISPTEAAALWFSESGQPINPVTLANRARRGELPAETIGGRTAFEHDAIVQAARAEKSRRAG